MKELSIGNLLPITGLIDFINDEENQLLGKQSLKKIEVVGGICWITRELQPSMMLSHIVELPEAKPL